MTASWIDLALADSETALNSSIDSLDDRDRASLIKEISEALGISEQEILSATLRLLIERVRPLVLPSSIWQRRPHETWSIRHESSRHLARFGIPVTEERLRSMQTLYARFSASRQGAKLRQSDLVRQNYACLRCGLRFYNDELSELGFVSPLGTRPRAKVDNLKPHWSREDYRRPTLDHSWPVSLYGGNAAGNLIVLCRACNEGKANYMALHQTRAFVGLPIRSELTNSGPVPLATFYAQLLRQPRCQQTGRGPTDCELTVRVRKTEFPPVMDNLITVMSPE